MDKTKSNNDGITQLGNDVLKVPIGNLKEQD